MSNLPLFSTYTNVRDNLADWAARSAPASGFILVFPMHTTDKDLQISKVVFSPSSTLRDNFNRTVRDLQYLDICVSHALALPPVQDLTAVEARMRSVLGIHCIHIKGHTIHVTDLPSVKVQELFAQFNFVLDPMNRTPVVSGKAAGDILMSNQTSKRKPEAIPHTPETDLMFKSFCGAALDVMPTVRLPEMTWRALVLSRLCMHVKAYHNEFRDADSVQHHLSFNLLWDGFDLRTGLAIKQKHRQAKDKLNYKGTILEFADSITYTNGRKLMEYIYAYACTAFTHPTLLPMKVAEGPEEKVPFLNLDNVQPGSVLDKLQPRKRVKAPKVEDTATSAAPEPSKPTSNPLPDEKVKVKMV